MTNIDNGFRKKHKCPYCGKNNDRACNFDDESLVPKNGDIGICMGCCEAFQFNEKMNPVKFDINKLDRNEFLEVKKSQRIAKMVKKEMESAKGSV